MYKMIFTVLGLTVGLFASNYAEGIKYYQDEMYDQAFPIIVAEAKNDNKAAQYRLAEMYEYGQGTEVDYEKSLYWYKSAASKYASKTPKKAADKAVDKDDPYLTSVAEQFTSNENIKAGAEFALAKVDTDTPETKSLLTSLIDGDFFGLQPYNANYLLPLSYSKDKPNRVSAIYGSNLPAPYDTYGENTEVAFQLSLKKQLTYDLFGMNEFITAAYTQKVWWQLYDESGPFRETNYLPEIFMTIPSSQSLDNSIGLKAVKLGFIHESNGQEGYRSRSWNRLYATGMWQWDNLFLAARVWYRLKEDRKPDWYYEQDPAYDVADIQAQSDGDDNPDIIDYLGYGDIRINYLYKKHKFGLLLRNNLDFDDNKGAIELNYAYPLFNSPNTSIYVKFFNGYGESLIDYNVDVTKASIGFSFSNGLF